MRLVRPSGVLALALAAGAVALVACADANTTVTTAVFTGIQVRSETLVTGYGCGTAAGQIFKYAVVVSYTHPQANENPNVIGAVYDCFTDANFQNLCGASGPFVPSAGTCVALPNAVPSALDYEYTLSVFAYDEPTFNLRNSNGAVLSAANSADLQTLATIPATYTTTCAAVEQSSIQVIANCGPLVPGSQ